MNLSLPEEIQNFGQKGMENDLKKGRLGHMENGPLETGEIVVYQPDEITRLEVKVEDDTVWLTQAQMAELFGRERTVITKHIRKIFEERELEEKSNVHFLHFANSDKPVKNIHDRFLIVDDTVYHIGASLKDLGKKLFAFSRMTIPPKMVL